MVLLSVRGAGGEDTGTRVALLLTTSPSTDCKKDSSKINPGGDTEKKSGSFFFRLKNIRNNFLVLKTFIKGHIMLQRPMSLELKASSYCTYWVV